jgi:hypothetical protein
MEKQVLRYHPSVLIIQKDKTQDLLMGVYDDTYPLVAYRNSANLIGGNPSSKDKNPRDVLLREIAEELNVNPGKEDYFAPGEDIKEIRNTILSNLLPFKDFFFHFGEIKGGRKEYKAIGSAFYCSIDRKIFDIAKKNIDNGKRLTTEGRIGVFNLEQLIKGGKFSTAHLTAPILGDYFNVNMPYPEEIKFISLSLPRDSFEEYLSDFNYEEGWRRN